jgi:hypothetical protein
LASVGRQSEITKHAWAVLGNSQLVQDSLGVYVAIGRNARELNQKHGHFWGVVQKNCMHQAILGIARIYDPQKRQVKHTIYQLHKDFCARTTKIKPSSYSNDVADALNISRLLASQSLYGDAKQRRESLREIQIEIGKKIDCHKESEALRKILDYRNKFLAHQENLTKAKNRMFSNLPKEDDFTALAKFAGNYAVFVNGMCNKVGIYVGVPRGKVSALNVIKGFLGKEFDLRTSDGRKAYDEFYCFNQ